MATELNVSPCPCPCPCPCCGSADVYTGPMVGSSFGAMCRKCGLNLSRDLPGRFPFDTDGMSVVEALAKCSALTTAQAVEAWNLRVTPS